MMEARQRILDFSRWLRTGRLVPAQLADARLEVKSNPYHDPANGQFTFAPGGGEGGGSERPSRQPAINRGRAPTDPKHPRNFGVYAVKTGDTLSHIAATRVGLTSADLKWLNDLPSDRLRVGQRLRLPHQTFLDEGKRAFDTYVALSTYMARHDGNLPPDVAHPPSLDEQEFGRGIQNEQRNGYSFVVDRAKRPRKVGGTITLAPYQRRSRSAQRAAGGNNRLSTDEGGHYVARRFNGPTDDFNHFAQNSDFNRSAYAKIENEWERATRRGEKVHITIIPVYPGASQRPESIKVTYSIGDRIVERNFPNSGRAGHGK